MTNTVSVVDVAYEKSARRKALKKQQAQGNFGMKWKAALGVTFERRERPFALAALSKLVPV